MAERFKAVRPEAMRKAEELGTRVLEALGRQREHTRHPPVTRYSCPLTNCTWAWDAPPPLADVEVPPGRRAVYAAALAEAPPGDPVSDLIDSTLADRMTGPDAMRWHPDAAEQEAASRNSADFSLAMLPSAVPQLTLTPVPSPPFSRELQVGEVITVDVGGDWNVSGRWRVTGQRRNEDGTWTTDLEPAW